jgi:MFS family permease
LTFAGGAADNEQMDQEALNGGTDPGHPPQPTPGNWLNRNVVGMGLTSLLSDASHETATVALPGFLTALGAPPFALGVIEGVSDALASFVKLGAGWWGDRIGHRKGIATAGYTLTGAALGLFALAYGWPLILVGRALAWFGRGVRAPLRDAILAESVAAGDRGKAFGFHRAGDTIGAILGPLAAAGLLYALPPSWGGSDTGSYRLIFLLTLIPGLGSAAAFGLLVREEHRPADHKRRFWASVRALPANYRRFLLGVGVFGAGDFSPTLLIAAAVSLLTPAYGNDAASVAALLFTLRNVLYAAASYPVGALSDRVGRRGLLALGYLLGSAVTAGFAAAFLASAAHLIWLLVLFILAGVFIAVVDALEGAMTADLVPDPSLRGTAYGVRGTVNGVGDFVSSTVVGLLWSVSPALGFGYAAVLMAAGAVLLHRVR